jgi:hypothetical protein
MENFTGTTSKFKIIIIIIIIIANKNNSFQPSLINAPVYGKLQNYH